MQIKPVLSIEQAERFCDTAETLNLSVLHKGNRNDALREAIGQTDKSSSSVLRWSLFYKLHGREKFIDYFARAIMPDYTQQDYLKILEFAVTTETPIDRTWVIFRCSRRRLETLSARRKKAKEWPQVEPAEPPSDIVRLLDEERFNDSSETAGNTSVVQASMQPNTNILAGDTIIAMGSTAKTVDQVKPHKKIHGKSQKEVIELQRPPHKDRRKDIAAAKREQEKIAKATEQVVTGIITTLGVKAQSSPNKRKLAQAQRVQQAPEFLAVIKGTLKLPKTYDSARLGRKSYYDPLAAGFDLLPKDVREASIKYYKLLDKAYLEATLAANNVSETASTYQRFQACYKLVQEHPEYPLKVVVLPFGFTYYNFKYYAKYRPKNALDEDPYLSSGAYDCLKKCALESGFRYGKYRLRQMMYERGYHYCIPTIAKLMKRCGIVAITGSTQTTHKYSSYEGNVGQLSPNLIKRDFSATAPFQKIVSDVTEISFRGQKVYLSIFEDLFNNEIRAYSISASPSVQFVVAGLKKLILSIPEDAKCIIHTDQGHQYQRDAYRKLFKQHNNIIQSMSRKGNCYDNGACEAWFGRFKEDTIQGHTFNSLNELVAAIERYISHYNNERIQMGLQGMSPVAYAHKVAAICLNDVA